MAHAHASWAGFAQYLRQHGRGAAAHQLRWIPLLRGESVTAKVRQLVVLAEGDEPSISEVDRQYNLAQAGLPAIALSDPFDTAKRRAYLAQLKAAFPELGTSRRKANALSKDTPGATFGYSADQGYALSIFWKLERYIATTGPAPQ